MTAGVHRRRPRSASLLRPLGRPGGVVLCGLHLRSGVPAVTGGKRSSMTLPIDLLRSDTPGLHGSRSATGNAVERQVQRQFGKCRPRPE